MVRLRGMGCFLFAMLMGLGLASSTACAPESLESGQCNDGVDNDFDGQSDFDDSDCQNWGDCMDGIDNDGDGQIDQADGGCAMDFNAAP